MDKEWKHHLRCNMDIPPMVYNDAPPTPINTTTLRSRKCLPYSFYQSDTHPDAQIKVFEKDLKANKNINDEKLDSFNLIYIET